ncbi:MAG: hypothetical protein ACR2OW_16685 [Methyloligellaceae bacterium]
MDPRLQELADDIIALKSKAARHVSGEFSTTIILVDEKLDEILELLEEAPKYVATDSRKDEDSVPYVVPDSPDELTRIKGIDKALAHSLSRLGVENFEAISLWTRSDVNRIGRELNLLSRIQRENWIEQAAILAAGKSTAFAETAKQGYVVISDRRPPAEKQIELPDVSDEPGQEPTELFADNSVREQKVPSQTLHANAVTTEAQDLEQSQVVKSEEVARANSLPEQSREGDQNFFRPPQPDSESVRTSDKKTAIPEQTGEDFKDQEEDRRQNEDTIPEQESRSEDDHLTQKIDTSDDQEKADFNKEIDGNRAEDKQIERKSTFPDFKQFGDPSTLAEVEIVRHKSGERIKLNNSPDVPRSQQPVEDSKSKEQRGVMRRFIRAIVNSDEK